MSAEAVYLHEIEWHRRRLPEANQRPAPLLRAQGEGWPYYPLADGDGDGGSKIIAPVYSVPTRIRGRVLCAEFDRDPVLDRHVLHVGLALSGMSSWPLLWRLDQSYIDYEDDLRLLVTPGYELMHSDAAGAAVAGLWRRYHGSERMHIHLIDAWQPDDGRLQALRRGQRVEIYGPVTALAVADPDGAMGLLFSELERPECWCIHPLRIDAC